MKLSRIITGVTILAMLTAPCVLSCWAQSGWETELLISSERAQNRLLFGQQADATNGIDGRFDVPAMLSGTLKASFEDDSGKRLWRDIKALEKVSWVIRVETNNPQAEVKLDWSPATLPKSTEVLLVDRENNKTISMHKTSSYSFNGQSSKTLSISLIP